jgi:hypothetical protein
MGSKASNRLTSITVAYPLPLSPALSPAKEKQQREPHHAESLREAIVSIEVSEEPNGAPAIFFGAVAR